MTERIKISETGNSKPDGMYITKKDADRFKLSCAIIIVYTVISSLFKLRRRHL